MATAISSKLDFLNKNPGQALAFAEIEHEVQHLDQRRKISKGICYASAALALASFIWVPFVGQILFGALAAIALLAYVYSNYCLDAQTALREKQVNVQLPKNDGEHPLIGEAKKPFLWFS